MENTPNEHYQPSLSDIKLELFHYARVEQEMLRSQVRELREEVNGYKKEIVSQNWKIMFLILGFLGASALSTYQSLHNWLQNTTMAALEKEVKSIQAQIHNELETPRITAIIGDQAKEYTEKNAQKYITEKVDRSIKPFNDAIQAKFARLEAETTKFNSYLDDTKSKYQKATAALANEVNILNQRNSFTRLGDAAIHGSGQAFDELIDNKENAKQDELKIIAEAESGRIKTTYLFLQPSFENDHLINTSNGVVKKDTDISTSVLIDLLRGKVANERKVTEVWSSRGLAAKYLGERREKGVPEALIDAACNDRSLMVRKLAIESYRNMLGDFSIDVLECKYIKDSWNKHKSEFEKGLH